MSVRNMLKVVMSLLLATAIAATAGTHQSPASVAVALHAKEESESSGLIPYTECIKKCSKCACTMMWPPESNMCLCIEDGSVPNKATTVTEKGHELHEKLDLLAGPVPKRTGGNDKKMVLWTTSKMETTLPYAVCIKICRRCACTLIWPPEASTCTCISPKPQAAGGKSVAK